MGERKFHERAGLGRTRQERPLRVRDFLPRMGVVEEFSKLGGRRDTRLYYLMVSTHCMVVTNSSMDIHFRLL
jgi:hypothetical protein